MATIRTSTGSFEVYELPGPRPGFVWLWPWDLTAEIVTKKGVVIERSEKTLGLVLQGRGGGKREREQVEAALQTLTHDPDAQAMVTESDRLEDRIGQFLPPPFPTESSGFIITTTDRRDNPDAPSSVRRGREAWSLIANEHRIWLLSKLPITDPLWAPRYTRPWMWEGCLPYFLRSVTASVRGRRTLIPAIPNNEPRRTLALRRIENVFKNEASYIRRCRVNRPRAMSMKEAAMVLGLVDRQIVFDSEYNPDKQIRRSSQVKIVNDVHGIGYPNLRKLYEDRWNGSDPEVRSDPEKDPSIWEVFNSQTRLLNESYERILLSRTLHYNPITGRGPRISDTKEGILIEGRRQIQKILRFETSPDVDIPSGLRMRERVRRRREGKKRIKFIVDAPFVWKLESPTLKIGFQHDEQSGEGKVGVLNFSKNIAAWIYVLFGVVPTPDVVEVDIPKNGSSLGDPFLDNMRL